MSFSSISESFGRVRTREELVASFASWKRQLNCGNLSFVNTAHSSLSSKKPFTSMSGKESLIPILINNLSVGKVHTGNYLSCKIFEDPVCSPNIHVLIEDDIGDAATLGIYTNEFQVERLKSGTRLIIKEPFFKVGCDGVPLIRVDNQEDICAAADDLFGSDKQPIDWKNFGNKFYKSQCYSAAATCYSQGLKSCHLLATLLSNRSQCYLDCKKFELAVVDAGAARTLDNKQQKAWLRETQAFVAMEEHKSAQNTAQKGLAYYPNLRTFLNLNTDQVNAHSLAKNWWMQINCTPQEETQDDCIDPLKEKELGNTFFHQGNLTKAIEAYTKAIASFTIFATLLNNRAACNHEEQRFSEAASDACCALLIQPNNGKALFRLTSAFLKLGHEDLAETITLTSGSLILQGLLESHKASQRNSKEKEPLSTSNDIGGLQTSIESLPAKTIIHPNISETIFCFPQKYLDNRGLPKEVDENDAMQALIYACNDARGIPSLMAYLRDATFDRCEIELLKRVRSPLRIEWYKHAEHGVVDTQDAFLDEFPYAANIYDSTICHSYSNSPDIKQVLLTGETHLSIGFCDLGILLSCDLTNACKSKPLHFIGVDQSAYSVAKFSVIVAMLSSGAIAESVLEVWFSVGWSERTWKDFRNGVSVSKSTSSEVTVILNFWKTRQPFSLHDARKKWLQVERGGVSSWIFNFLNDSDIFDAVDYMLSGDVIGDENSNAMYGSTTMFDLPKMNSEFEKGESILHTIEIEDLVKLMSQNKSFKSALRQLKLVPIERLRKWILDKIVNVTLLHGQVSSKNCEFITELAKYNPSSISWSNCADSMLRQKEFHALARKLGSINCSHFAYSLNWWAYLVGPIIVDYPHTLRNVLLNRSIDGICVHWKNVQADQYLRWPPLDNPVNFYSFEPSLIYMKNWLEYFFSPDVAGGPVNKSNSTQMLLQYSPFHRSVSQINFSWTYDMEMRSDI